ncbi:hypothetical protein [Halomontanus rarus]|uniref:hypothetical protein n=1 Tax=Halomontanus rarus TaxID=3034020 RepID=UPI001A98D475
MPTWVGSLEGRPATFPERVGPGTQVDLRAGSDELEKKLDGLADEAEDPTQDHIEWVRGHLQSYRGSASGRGVRARSE